MFSLKDKGVNINNCLWMNLADETELNFALIELAKLKFGEDGMELVSIERGKNKQGKEYITVLYTMHDSKNTWYNKCYGPLYEETKKWNKMKMSLAYFKAKRRLQKG